MNRETRRDPTPRIGRKDLQDPDRVTVAIARAAATSASPSAAIATRGRATPCSS
jgi:hypothetical protein